MLLPKVVTVLQEGYSWRQFLRDCVAGVTVGLVALPLAIAFAIASGVSPERGLVTAVIAGFLISTLGGSRVQIGGPTGAFIVVVSAIMLEHGIDGLLLATLMAGILLVVMGLAGLGAAIKFIPYPLIVGFTSGIAVIIFSAQLKDLLGLPIQDLPADFIAKWGSYFTHLHQIQPYEAAIGIGCLVLMQLWTHVSEKIPPAIIALLAGTVVVHLFNLPVETIGSRFGEIPHTLPAPVLPAVSWAALKELSSPALTIALLAGIESLLSAVVADGMIGGRHRSNMELVAQGIANIASPLFGGIPATGAIARTVTNIQNGGRTPIAGIVHAITLLFILLFFGQWAGLIPMAALAAILVRVAYNMSEWRSFLMLLRSPRSDVAVLIVTFGLTILIDLTVAIEVGMVLAVLLFMRRMSQLSRVAVITREWRDEEDPDDPQAIRTREVPHGVEVYEIAGPLFFGASFKFQEAMQVTHSHPKVRIIRMRQVSSIDATGIHALKEQFKKCKHHGIAFVLSGVRPNVRKTLEKSGLLEQLGHKNTCSDIDEALQRARELLAERQDHRPPPSAAA